MHFSQLILKNLTRRPFRTTLTLFALTTGIASVVALLGIARGFQSSFESVYSGHGIDLVVSRQGSADRLSSAVDQEVIGRIAEVVEKANVAGVLLETLSIEEKQLYGLPTMGVDVASWLLQDYALVNGHAILANESKTVMLGIHLAERMQVTSGDELKLFDETYRIAGVFKSLSTWENGSMIMRLDELQAITDRTGQVTYINVRLPSKQQQAGEIETLTRQIESLDKKLLALPTQDFVRSDTRMQLASAMAGMTSLLALLMGGFGILNTMMTSVMERTQEIGILRAIGWSKSIVVRMIVGESCALATLASLLGFGVAIVLTGLLAQQPETKGLLDPRIDLSLFLQTLTMGLVVGLIGALLPAWRAMGMVPTEAFRQQ